MLLHPILGLPLSLVSLVSIVVTFERLATMPTCVARQRAKDRLLTARYDRDRELIEGGKPPA